MFVVVSLVIGYALFKSYHNNMILVVINNTVLNLKDGYQISRI